MGDKGEGKDKGKTKKESQARKGGLRPHEQRLIAEAPKKPT